MPKARPQPSVPVSFRIYVLVVIAVRKNPVTWDTDFSGGLTDRGYTMHSLFRPFGKHLDDFGSINMLVLTQRTEGGNGRIGVYPEEFGNPLLGRFLSPDPFVTSPDNPQNYNRYSYVLNNPVRYTDPSGYSVQPHPSNENWNYSPAHNDINSNLSMQGVDWRSNLWGKDQHFWYLSLSDFQEQYGELSYTNYLYANGYLGGTNSARNIFIQLRDAINAGFNISIVYAFGRNTIVSSIGDLGDPYFGQNGAVGFDNPTASAFLQEANVGASSQGDGITRIPKSDAVSTLAGASAIPVNTIKGGFDAARVTQKTVSTWSKGARVLGRTSNILAAATVSYDFATGTANTSTLVNAGVAVVGAGVVFAVGIAAAPWVAAGGVVYGIVSLAGGDDWLNSKWDISDKINIVNPSGQ